MSHPYLEVPQPMAFGHRGASGHAPENTLESFRLAVESGVDALELDIRPSSDGEPVVFHDERVERVTDGCGPVSRFTLGELKELDAGYRFTTDGGRTFPYRGRGLTIPSLEEVLGQFGTVRLNIDLKVTDRAMELSFERLLDRFGARERVLACSSDSGVAGAIRGRFAGAATSASPREVALLLLLTWLGLGRFGVPQVDAIQVPRSHRGIRVLTPALIRAAHSRGVVVHVWTVNDVQEMEDLVRMGVDGIISDYPDRLMEVLRRLGKR